MSKKIIEEKMKILDQQILEMIELNKKLEKVSFMNNVMINSQLWDKGKTNKFITDTANSIEKRKTKPSKTINNRAKWVPMLEMEFAVHCPNPDESTLYLFPTPNKKDIQYLESFNLDSVCEQMNERQLFFYDTINGKITIALVVVCSLVQHAREESVVECFINDLIRNYQSVPISRFSILYIISKWFEIMPFHFQKYFSKILGEVGNNIHNDGSLFMKHLTVISKINQWQKNFTMLPFDNLYLKQPFRIQVRAIDNYGIMLPEDPPTFNGNLQNKVKNHSYFEVDNKVEPEIAAENLIRTYSILLHSLSVEYFFYDKSKGGSENNDIRWKSIEEMFASISSYFAKCIELQTNNEKFEPAIQILQNVKKIKEKLNERGELGRLISNLIRIPNKGLFDLIIKSLPKDKIVEDDVRGLERCYFSTPENARTFPECMGDFYKEFFQMKSFLSTYSAIDGLMEFAQRLQNFIDRPNVYELSFNDNYHIDNYFTFVPQGLAVMDSIRFAFYTLTQDLYQNFVKK